MEIESTYNACNFIEIMMESTDNACSFMEMKIESTDNACNDIEMESTDNTDREYGQYRWKVRTILVGS